MPPVDPDQGGPRFAGQEHTEVLLARIRGGDHAAREALLARYLPVLRRWATRRLPRASRDLRDTDDLVQETLLRVVTRIESFESRGEGAFLAYLRQSLLNRIRDEIRASSTRPVRAELDESMPDSGPSTIDLVIGRDRLERFERALATLDAEQREAIVMRIEFGFSHQQVAEAIGKPTANAARMTVARALVELAKAMQDG
jgi:RNA polymerase sigma-70 factor (ECF subfamily)